jgi:hypothetical protein
LKAARDDKAEEEAAEGAVVGGRVDDAAVEGRFGPAVAATAAEEEEE